MKIEELVLYNYKRFALNKYKYFKYRPQEKLQFIIGTNGSGKSSLLRELSPMPASSNDFYTGGYKQITISQNNNKYVLKSSFTQGSKHSFIENDTELNPSGTQQIQKELIYKYFNITPDIHDVLISSSNFTTMSVAQRREWFTRLSNINFNFAMEVYNNFKNKLKDVDTILKYQQSLLMTETSKLMNEEELNKTHKEISLYKEAIDFFVELSSTYSNYTDKNIDTVRSNLKNAIHIFKSNLNKLTYEEKTYTNIEGLILESEKDAAIYDHDINKIGKELETNQQLLESLSKVNTQEINDLEKELDNIITLKELTINKLQLLSSHYTYEEMEQSLLAAQETLNDLLRDLVTNPDGKYNREYYNQLESSLKDVKTKKTTVETNIEKCKSFLANYEHLKTHSSTECPKCKHIWIQGYDEQKEKTIKERLNNEIELLLKIDIKLKELTAHMDEVKTYLDKYAQYKRIEKSLPILNKLWSYIQKENLLLNDPKAILIMIDRAFSELTLIKNIKLYNSQIENIEMLLKYSNNNNSLNVDKLKSRNEELEQQLYDNRIKLNSARQHLNRYRNISTTLSLFKKLQEQLVTNVNSYDEIIKSDISNLKKQAIHNLIRTLTVKYNELQLLVNSTNIQITHINNIKKEIHELTQRKIVLTHIVNGLSPKDGLIAKSISSFINSFVKKINKVISEIWSYEFKISLINTESDLDLDYKFEVTVNDVIINDIQKCSSGMKEIIDLAFKLISMHYLKLQNMPIYLDEFGKSMDSVHRSKALTTITQLLSYSSYSQIFVISHFEQSYANTRNADIVVLNFDNILIDRSKLTNSTLVIEEEECLT